MTTTPPGAGPIPATNWQEVHGKEIGTTQGTRAGANSLPAAPALCICFHDLGGHAPHCRACECVAFVALHPAPGSIGTGHYAHCWFCGVGVDRQRMAFRKTSQRCIDDLDTLSSRLRRLNQYADIKRECPCGVPTYHVHGGFRL